MRLLADKQRMIVVASIKGDEEELCRVCWGRSFLQQLMQDLYGKHHMERQMYMLMLATPIQAQPKMAMLHAC